MMCAPNIYIHVQDEMQKRESKKKTRKAVSQRSWNVYGVAGAPEDANY